ncbi:hypothetical protein ASPACDRAFT_50145 [Aspergillus aculeatus ATCC 16872]|uniref:Uncharacterized protein n=1 Tax=Aspergillus aculeatus (strain ATCC 16872 / CBS 172.66 / WB 5094) TaxID=690307 RepID=A0A1L9X723_ASPA1|nr:uncharacterized protein ASPACDRAFT_50145 [Aspergillus aculeatus ATCC 16872]OJK04266.1 hypothetical protein ASPACDRAFT_50145 [Aspergillus aculeatus ATCC 16872]
MPSIPRLAFLSLVISPLVWAQLKTINVITPGVTPTTSVSSTDLASSSSSSSSTSSSTTTSARLPTSLPSTATTLSNPLDLTTIFTQPSDCAGGITEIAAWSTELWQNIVNPIPTLSLSSCYPSQFYSSAIATTILPPYTQLVCPLDWETYNLTETYLICCPSGYGVYLPNYHNATRPGLGAVCTSSVWPSVLMDITRYDAAGKVTVIPTSAGEDGTLVFATAFDGTSAAVVGEASATAGGVSGSLGGGSAVRLFDVLAHALAECIMQTICACTQLQVKVYS